LGNTVTAATHMESLECTNIFYL